MARDFDGTGNEYITYTLPSLDLTLVSVSYHFNIDSNSQYKRFFELNTDSSNKYRMEFDDSWGWVFKAGWSGGASAWSVGKPSTGSWHSTVVTYDGGSTSNNPSIYSDGVDGGNNERFAPSGTFDPSGINKLTLGANTGGGASGIGSWNGRGAEFGVWNRILTAGEAMLLSKGYAPTCIPNGLKIYSALIGQYSNEIDAVSGASGTITGTPGAASHPAVIYPKTSFAI